MSDDVGQFEKRIKKTLILAFKLHFSRIFTQYVHTSLKKCLAKQNHESLIKKSPVKYIPGTFDGMKERHILHTQKVQL